MRRLNRIVVALGLVAGLVGWAGNAFGASNLEKAYQKEFAHLEAQKRALEKRLEQLETRSENQIAEAEKKRDQLQGKLTSLREQGDALKRKLAKVQRESDSKGRGRDILRTTLDQAETTLEPFPVEFEAPKQEEKGSKPNYGTMLPALFEKATRAIDRSRSLRAEEGSFFLPDGSKTSGTLYHVGNVASYGVSKKAAGPLAPAGKGRLKLWKKSDGETARAIAEGEMPGTLGAFLYESAEENVEPKKEETWLDTIDSGGVIAWVIVGMAGVGLLLVLARLAILALAGYRTKETIRTLTELVERGETGRAAAACEERDDAASRVMGAALDNLERQREELEDLVSEALLRETPRIERFGAPILVFAAVAPLLGLLGTVTGMISTFDVITKFGTGDPRMLSGGISEALVTTQLGLITAIPLLLVGNLLKGWAEKVLTRLERGALRVINLAEAPARADGADGTVEPAPTPEDANVDEETVSSEEDKDVSDYLGAV